MKLWPGSRNQAGDTIVEVLIALAVISTVIVGAFLVVQKSTTAVRDSQEHGEMQQLLQGQIELIRAMALTSDKDAAIFSYSSKYFCIDNSRPAVPAIVPFPSGFALKPDANSDDYTDYPSACKNVQNYYNIAITYKDNTFYATGRWDRLNGGKDQETMDYRIYPNQKLASLGSVAPPGIPDTGFDNDNPRNTGNGTDGGPTCVNKPGNSWNTPSCWRFSATNRSIPGVKLAKCIWDYGDKDPATGAVLTGPPSRVEYDGSAPECQYGTKVAYLYKYRTTPPNQATFTITLTNIAVNGQSSFDMKTISRPANP